MWTVLAKFSDLIFLWSEFFKELVAASPAGRVDEVDGVGCFEELVAASPARRVDEVAKLLGSVGKGLS